MGHLSVGIATKPYRMWKKNLEKEDWARIRVKTIQNLIQRVIVSVECFLLEEYLILLWSRSLYKFLEYKKNKKEGWIDVVYVVLLNFATKY